mmetsp:Transcript_61514/g.84674  ORF Transcript_61514/g.84674 Transcript_61514/m.84674 type:complete len:209 (-) Transcript_61514:97-723(-)
MQLPPHMTQLLDRQLHALLLIHVLALAMGVHVEVGSRNRRSCSKATPVRVLRRREAVWQGGLRATDGLSAIAAHGGWQLYSGLNRWKEKTACSPLKLVAIAPQEEGSMFSGNYNAQCTHEIEMGEFFQSLAGTSFFVRRYLPFTEGDASARSHYYRWCGFQLIARACSWLSLGAIIDLSPCNIFAPPPFPPPVLLPSPENLLVLWYDV